MGEQVGAEIELCGSHGGGRIFDFGDDGGDIVASTASIGAGDQSRDDLFTACLGEDGDDLIFDQVVGEAVGAEQELIAGFEFEPKDIGSDALAVSDGLEKGVAKGDVGGIFDADESFAELFLDESLIVGELFDFFVADAVDAAISDVSEQGFVGRDEQQHGEGGSHVASDAFLFGEFEDFEVCGLDGPFDDLLEPSASFGAGIEGKGFDAAHGVVDVVSDGFGSALACEFAVFVSAHPIGYNKESVDGICEKVVFVVFSDASDIAFDPRLDGDLCELGIGVCGFSGIFRHLFNRTTLVGACFERSRVRFGKGKNAQDRFKTGQPSGLRTFGFLASFVGQGILLSKRSQERRNRAQAKDRRLFR